MHTELFQYCSFSTHRYTLNYFSTANSIQSWHFVIYVWINPCIIWPNFVHEFGSISCLFIVKIIVMPWNTRQVTDPSLQRCHINVADMNMHVFTKCCVWIRTEHFLLMVSMDLELLWICSCWMFCSPSFVLAFRVIRCLANLFSCLQHPMCVLQEKTWSSPGWLKLWGWEADGAATGWSFFFQFLFVISQAIGPGLLPYVLLMY